MICAFSRIWCAPERLEEYLKLRKETIDPGMASAPGFIRRELFKSMDADDEIILQVYWDSRESALNYRKSRTHDGLKSQALQVMKRPLETHDYEIIDQ